MHIRFKKNRQQIGRLHVGFIHTNYADVWYEPILEFEDGDGAADVGLYKVFTGDAGYREPMEGEVLWHPFYDPKNFEARDKRAKDELHRRFMTDAYKYLMEQDPVKVQETEDDEMPKGARWDRWLAEAKKIKRARMKRQSEGYDSDSDSAVSVTDEKEKAQRQWQKKAKEDAANMPPPRKPSAANGKRKTRDNKPGRAKQGPKKAKPAPNGGPSPSVGHQGVDGLFMGGARGPGSVLSSRASIYGGESDDEDDDESELFDYRHPTVPRDFSNTSQNALGSGSWNFDGINSLPTPQASGVQRPSSRSPSQGTKRGSQNGQAEDGEERGGVERHSPGQNVHRADGVDPQHLANRINGVDVDEDEAERAAIRASLAPEDRNGQNEAGISEQEQEQIDAAVRASLVRQDEYGQDADVDQEMEDGVLPSTEEPDEEE